MHGRHGGACSPRSMRDGAILAAMLPAARLLCALRGQPEGPALRTGEGETWHGARRDIRSKSLRTRRPEARAFRPRDAGQRSSIREVSSNRDVTSAPGGPTYPPHGDGEKRWLGDPAWPVIGCVAAAPATPPLVASSPPPPCSGRCEARSSFCHRIVTHPLPTWERRGSPRSRPVTSNSIDQGVTARTPAPVPTWQLGTSSLN